MKDNSQMAAILECNDSSTLGKNHYPITVMYLIDTYVSASGGALRGGAEKQLYLLASSLSQNKFRPIVVQLSSDAPLTAPISDIGHLEIIHLPTQRIYGPGGFRQVIRLLLLAKKRKVDIIHTFFEKSEVMGWLTARLAGIPNWITSRRDLGFKRKRIYDKIFRLTVKDCKKCIVNCGAVKDQIVRQNGLERGTVEVIYNGLDPAGYQKLLDGDSLRRGLGLENGTPLVGMIANFNFEIKGHIYFLGAAKKILKEVPGVKFILVGDGPLKARYEEMARELRLQKNAFFLGNRADVPNIISNLDVSVLSSTSEGLSNVILESMAGGKPVVATDVGGSKEMIQDGITGYLVPPSDSNALAKAIVDLLRNPDKAVAMGEMGRKIVKEQFTVEAMVKKFEKLYFSLLEEGGD